MRVWLASDFYHELKRLNPDITIAPSRLTSKVNGLYVRRGMGRKFICAVDRDKVPVLPIYDDKGNLIKLGARDVITSLVNNKVLSRYLARKLYSGLFENNRAVPFLVEKSEETRGEKARKDFKDLAQLTPGSFGYNEDLHRPNPVSMSDLSDLTKVLADTDSDEEKAEQDVRNFERAELLKA